MATGSLGGHFHLHRQPTLPQGPEDESGDEHNLHHAFKQSHWAFRNVRTRRPLFRLRTVTCDVKKEFTYNEGFAVEHGGEYFKDGEIWFPELERPTPDSMGVDGTYRSVFGPTVANTGLIYGVTNNNVRLAMRRLTDARGSLELDKAYMDQQSSYIASDTSFLTHIRNMMERHCYQYDHMVAETQRHHADPHMKRLLRIDAWEELQKGSWNGSCFTDRLWLRSVCYKMKKDEVAKPGKYPRMIGDLGVAASLQGFWITKLLKKALAREPIEYLGGRIEFCDKPHPDVLAEIFRKLLNPPGRYYFVYFSDDSCLSFRVGEEVHVMNVDISKCDGSHGPAIFQTLIDIAPAHMQDDMRRLVEQCKCPIKVYDTNDRKRYVKLRPKQPRLYSGATITTLINNIANILICKAFAETHNPTSSRAVIDAAATAGYLVTCQVATRMEHIQFLKHSPVLDTNGKLRAMLNLGVLLRASGQCKGDLPGKKSESVSDRARRFQNALLRGMYPTTQFRLLTNLFSRTLRSTVKEDVAVARTMTTRLASSETFYVDSEHVFRRYELTPDQIHQIEDGFGLGSYGDHFANDALDKILETDYGLSCKYA